jgi:hypothetical protein
MSWEEFCQLLLDRFGKQEHKILIRRLFHIKQTTTVTAYIDQFAQLLDQLRAYQTITDPLYYTMKFLDGLKDDIKSVVMIQRPKDLDTAFVLAQLQEDVGDTAKKRELRKWDMSLPFGSYSKGPMPLPLPPNKPSSSLAAVNDKLGLVPAKQHSITEERLSNLYAYHKAQGLCYKCGLAYSKGHKCPDVVQLHLVEELWQQLDLCDSDDPPVVDEDELHNLLLSQSAAGLKVSSKTMKFRGSIQGLELLILLDSGSSHTFLSASVAAQIKGCSLVDAPMPVQVANGHNLLCAYELRDTVWFLNEYQFQSTLKILPLTTYDMVVDMDWLELHSPMSVHWLDKWLTIPYRGSIIKLLGLQSSSSQCAVLELCHITMLPDKDTRLVQELPEALQHLLARFSHVFALPQGLPPARDCDHHIPLLPGVRPVQIRTYRYALALKIEIEKQVDEML